MIGDLIDDDKLLEIILGNSHFTKPQIDSLMLAFQYRIEGYSLNEIIKMRDSGPVSKGSYLRTLSQAKNNFRKSLNTLLLVIYLGVLDTNTISSFTDLSERLNSLKDIEIPVEVIDEIDDIINEICDRITGDKVI